MEQSELELIDRSGISGNKVSFRILSVSRKSMLVFMWLVRKAVNTTPSGTFFKAKTVDFTCIVFFSDCGLMFWLTV